MNTWRAIVFDLDDTLYPERQYVLSGFRAVSTWAGDTIHVPADAVYSDFVALYAAGVRGDTFNRWLKARGLPMSHVPAMIEAYRSHVPDVKPFPGIPSLLRKAAAACPLGLVSDGYLKVQQAKFAALGLARHFRAVVFTDELGRDCWKPSTIPFEYALSLLAVPGSDAVYVGDNSAKDFIGARAAGMATIHVSYAVGDYISVEPPSSAHAADYKAESIADLAAILNCG